MHNLTFGNSIIHYEVQYSSRRRTIAIQVDENGVYVIAPIDTSLEKIEQIVQQKASWIMKQQEDFKEITDYENERSFQSGEKLPYIGRNYRLKIIATSVEQASFRFYQGKFIAYVPSTFDSSSYRDMLYPLYRQWVIERGNQLLNERLQKFHQKYPLTPRKVSIRDQQQRWGSCTPDGHILLNWRIFLAPMHTVDYVIAHELAHLKVMDHSSKFWDTVAMLYPEFERSREWLRVKGRTLYI